MTTFLTVFHVVVCILLVATVLLQFGKGAEVGAVMGGGASQAIFSSSAKGNFLSKMTTVLAISFMVSSVTLSVMKTRSARESLFDDEVTTGLPGGDMAQEKAETPKDPQAESKAQAQPEANSPTE